MSRGHRPLGNYCLTWCKPNKQNILKCICVIYWMTFQCRISFNMIKDRCTIKVKIDAQSKLRHDVDNWSLIRFQPKCTCAFCLCLGVSPQLEIEMIYLFLRWINKRTSCVGGRAAWSTGLLGAVSAWDMSVFPLVCAAVCPSAVRVKSPDLKE